VGPPSNRRLRCLSSRHAVVSRHLESRLPSPLPTKDGGTLYAAKDIRAYVLGLAHSRSEHLYWQRAHQLSSIRRMSSLSAAKSS
jgi:hypothetical protein